MVKIKRTSTPRQLAKTNKEFKDAILGLDIADAYQLYKRNKNKYRYNTVETKQKFKKMNNKRCSFCTRYITEFDNEMTVEHIKTKSAFPKYIFQWSNLLCSCKTCNTKRSTNLHDKSKYLDPTKIENIEDFFCFKTDGTITENTCMDLESQEKARYMIELYKLYRPELECERREFIKDLLEDDDYFNCLKSRRVDSKAIIYLDVFAYYNRRKKEE